VLNDLGAEELAREPGTRHDHPPRDLGAFPHRYESKPFISRIQTDREPLPEQQQHQQREEGGGQRWSGL
jgi:hypothetical protein